jgi:hypothetical protein
MKTIVRPDADFIDGMRKARVSKTNLARNYLRAMELFGAEPNEHPELGGILEDTTVYNLEHVLPAVPGEGWNLTPEELQSLGKRLGNMALLDPTVNVGIGNKSFQEKRKVYQASPLKTTQRIAQFDDWGLEQIDQRQSEMAEAAVKIWPI